MSQKQVSDQCHIDLGKNGIFRVAEKGLDLEILLDEPEKYLDLPAIFVNIGYGTCRQRHVAGQEHKMFPGFMIPIADTAQYQSLLPVGDLDELVGGDTGRLVHGIAFKDSIAGVTFEAGDQEYFGFTQCSEPVVVDIASIENHDRTLGQLQKFGDVDFVAFGFGDSDHCREIAVMIQEGVQFDAGLGGSELGPGKQSQTQVHHRGVETEQLVFKRKFVPRSLGEATPVEFAEQGFEKGVRSRVVGVGKGGSGHRLGAEMVEVVGGGTHAHDLITKAVTPSQLEVEEVDELVPPRKRSRRALSAMLLR